MYVTAEGTERWNVTAIYVDSGIMSTQQFDAVLICNG